MAVLNNAGCSVLFVDGPGADRRDAHGALVYPQCDDSNTLPYVDIAIAVLGLSVAATPNYGGGAREASLVGLGASVVYAASAMSGFGRVKACRRARIRYATAQPITVYGPPGSVR